MKKSRTAIFPLDTPPRLLYVRRVNEKIDGEIRCWLLKLLSENPRMTQGDLFTSTCRKYMGVRRIIPYRKTGLRM